MDGPLGVRNERREMMGRKFLIWDFGFRIVHCQQSTVDSGLWTNKFLTLIAFVCISIFATAQPYQKDIKSGNKAFEQKSFADAEVNYKKAAEANPEGFEGWFNLGDALYKQGRYDEALEAYEKGGQFAGSKYRAAAALHNIGNTYSSKKQFDKAAEAYKEALRQNPNDAETRYNLAKALRELKQQEQQNKDDKDQNKDDKKDDKNEDQEKNDQEKKDDPKNDQNDPQKENNENEDAKKKEDQSKEEQQSEKRKEGEDDQKDKGEQQPDGQPQQQKMSKEEMERLLEAIANAEKQTRAKLDKKKKAQVKVTPGVKDW